MTAPDHVTLTDSAGAIWKAQSGVINTGVLTTISVGGTILTNANNVASFHANNTGSGNITLIDTASLLTITGITNTGSSGNVTLINSGNVTSVTISRRRALSRWECPGWVHGYGQCANLRLGLYLYGGTGADSFIINQTAAVGMTINGQGGSDQYSIFFGSINGPVTIHDTGSSSDTDRAFLYGTNNAGGIPSLFRIPKRPTYRHQVIKRWTTTAAAWSNSTVIGGSKNDTFNVTASPTLSIFLDGGGTETIPPGNTVNITEAYDQDVYAYNTGFNGRRDQMAALWCQTCRTRVG